MSRRPKGEADVESREDYEDSLYQPSGGEEEDEHEHGHGVRAAKVEEEHPWETVRCDCEAPSVLRTLAQQQKRRGTGCVAAGVHRVAFVKLACAKVPYR